VSRDGGGAGHGRVLGGVRVAVLVAGTGSGLVFGPRHRIGRGVTVVFVEVCRRIGRR